MAFQRFEAEAARGGSGRSNSQAGSAAASPRPADAMPLPAAPSEAAATEAGAQADGADEEDASGATASSPVDATDQNAADVDDAADADDASSEAASPAAGQEAAPPAADDEAAGKAADKPVQAAPAGTSSSAAAPAEPELAARGDARNLFSRLCILASPPAEDRPSHRLEVPSRLLAMELLLDILESAGPALHADPVIMNALESSLCVSLIAHCVSDEPAVVSMALRLVTCCVQHYARPLAQAVPVLVSSVLLELVDSPNADFEQRSLVMRALKSLASSKTTILELFMNYDCSEREEAVFEAMVTRCAAIAQGRAGDAFNASQKTAAQDRSMKSVAMQTLCACMDALYGAIAQRVTGDLAPATASEEPASSEGAAVDAAGAGAAGPGESASSRAKDSPEPDLASPAGGSDSAEASATAKPPPSLASEYGRIKSHRAMMERAALKFKAKPRKGVEYMEEVGLIAEHKADAVAAALLKYQDSLDKTAIGDYLGEEKPFNLEVLAAYAKAVDMTDLTFDGAIRHFLSGFRLPGEGQKIDRIMERFAERYCEQNTGVFPSPDTAFILAFSVIMLQTDAHNPNIKPDRKMTKAGFISNNRGIADGDDLPADFLSAIYDAIVSTPITLKEDESRAARMVSQTGDVKARRAAFSAERKNIRSMSVMRLHSRRDGSGAVMAAEPAEAVFYTADAVDLATLGAAFEVVWGPLLAAVSVVLGTVHGGPDALAMVGSLSQAARAAGMLHMQTEHAAIVRAMVRFSGLSSARAPLDADLLSERAVACIRALVDLALHAGEWMSESWTPVAAVLSGVASLVHSQDGGVDASTIPNTEERFVVRDPETAVAMEAAATVAAENTALVSAAVRMDELERAYTSSTKLPDEGFAALMSGLCDVALVELGAVSASAGRSTAVGRLPSAGAIYTRGMRLWSLQKLVECADWNMDRPRVVWARVWDTLAQFFTTVCVSARPAVAQHAVDSLRQLSTKFLRQADTRRISFQVKFLAPFAAIMQAQPPPPTDIRELTLHVLAALVREHGARLASGWPAVLNALGAAGRSESGALVQQAFEALGEVSEFTAKIAAAGGLKHVTTALQDFAANPDAPTKIACQAVELLVQLAVRLGYGTALSTSAASAPSPAATSGQATGSPSAVQDHSAAFSPCGRVEVPASALQVHKAVPAVQRVLDSAECPGAVNQVLQWDDRELHLGLWWPVLTALASLGTDGRVLVRTHALDGLFSVLLRFGAGFSPELWRLVYAGVITPVFDDIQHATAAERRILGSPDELNDQRGVTDASWLRTSAGPALSWLAALHAAYVSSLPALLPRYVALIAGVVSQPVEGLARAGLAAWQQFLDSAREDLSEQDWDVVCKTMVDMFKSTTPTALFRGRAALLAAHGLADETAGGTVHESAMALATSVGRDAAMAVARTCLGRSVLTPYGPGSVVGMKDDGAVAVQLPWGMLFAVNALAIAVRPTASQLLAESASALPAALPFSVAAVVTACVAQLELISAARIALSTPSAMSAAARAELLTALADSARMAGKFNADRPLRKALWLAGFLKVATGSKLPSLLRQETCAIQALVDAALHEVAGGHVAGEQLLEAVLTASVARLEGLDARADAATGQSEDAAEVVREIQTLGPVVAAAMEQTLLLPAQDLQRLSSWLRPMVLRLIPTADVSVRIAIARGLASQATSLALFSSADSQAGAAKSASTHADVAAAEEA